MLPLCADSPLLLSCLVLLIHHAQPLLHSGLAVCHMAMCDWKMPHAPSMALWPALEA